MEQHCQDGPTPVVVGYETGIPPVQVGNGTRVARVLERAFPKPCFEIVPKSYQRKDIGPSVVRGLIDVGVVGIAAPESSTDSATTALLAEDTQGVDTLLLHPASYSVVSTRPESASPIGAQSPSPWLLVPAGALLGIAVLLVCVFLLNFKLPRLDRWFERATQHVDPQLTGFRRALEWLYGTASGRLFALAWALLGVVLAVQGLSARALTDETAPDDDDYLRGAQLAAYPRRDVYEYRNARWKRCPRPFHCLRNYDHGESDALAGDRDVLCQHARETRAAELHFRPDISVPMMYALMLPRPSQAAQPALQQSLLAAVREESYPGTPWRPCEEQPLASAQSAASE